jgi:hypothetical protein
MKTRIVSRIRIIAAPALALAAALAATPALPAQAINYGQPLLLWTGNAGWTGPFGILLGGVTQDRTITLRSANLGMRYLWFDENVTALNQINIWRNGVTVYGDITLGTTGGTGGANKIFISNYELGGTGATTSNIFNMGDNPATPGKNKSYIYLNAGGILQFGGKVENSGNNASGFQYGDVVLNGGALNIENAVKAGTDNSVVYRLGAGAGLTINSGALTFTNTSSHADAGNGYLGDIRFMIDGNLVMNTGGHIANTGNVTRSIWLYGAENRINGGTLDSRIDFYLLRTGDSSLISSTKLNGIGFRVSGNATGTIGSGVSGKNYTNLTFQQTASAAGNSIIARLATTLALDTNQALPSSVGGPNVDTTYGIDTNANTLDLTGNTNLWTPNRAGSSGTATWALTDGSGAATGQIIATGFKFDSANVAVTIGDGVTLVAKGDARANNLGSGGGGAIAATSTFVYDGGNGKSATLASNLALGKLRVRSGSLAAASALTAAGNLHVDADATFATATNTVTANGGVTLDIASATTWGRITGATTLTTTTNTLALEFNLLAPDVMTDGNTWTLLDGGLSTQTRPITVTITGTCVLSLVRDATGIWTALTDDDALRISFTETTGMLSISSAAAVPEPGHAVILFGGMAGMLFLCMAAIRRRPRA